MEQTVYTVSELNLRVKALLESEPMLQNVCVVGEVSNYKIHPSGHHYFTMKDAGGSLRCVMFKSDAARLRFRPENGLRVTALGQVTVYPRDGAYQLRCAQLIPQGLGDLHMAFEQLKKKLAAEGLFDPAHKKPIPRFPGRIAVITSGAGAAVRDIIRITGARWPLTKILVMPVRVQGAEAPPEIVGALNYANRHHVADLIITGRGGGSIEDLWAFNDERVARAIYASEIPVISAVGHEPDVTIADYVADRRAATPSNGAEIATPDRSEIYDILRGAEARCGRAMAKRLETYRSRVRELRSRRVMQGPMGYIDVKRMELDMLRGRLQSRQEGLIAAARQGQIRLAAALDALSPLKVLSRGYAIAEGEGGRLVRALADVETGGQIRVSVSDGALKCTVNEKEAGTHDSKERTGL